MNDLRFAFRQLLKNPGFTAAAVLTLALGIGANTAMFTLVDGFLLRPLPVYKPDELVQLYSRDATPEKEYRFFSYPDFRDLRERNSVFVDVLARQMTMVGVTEGDTTRRAFAEIVSASYFSTLGVRLARGREFLADEDDREVRVAIVSDTYWRKLGSDPELVGKTIRLNGTTFTIVGIAPAGFTGTMALLSPEFWLPLGTFESIGNASMTGG